MRTLSVLGLVLVASTTLLCGAECDSTAVAITTADGVLTITNNSSKPMVAYVLADAASKSNDGSPVRTYSAVFTGKDSLAPGKSMDVGKLDSRPAAIFVDYIRFADGSTCGNTTTQQGKAAAARFPSEKSN
jgi:hypothetical protein